jgi:toxin-antitoxin system PIN domain toxin
VDLLDLNVWFALLVPEHPFHPRARAYWEEASDPFLVRVTALGLLRLLTNAKAMDGKPLGVREAWEVYRELRLGSGVPLLEEPQGLDEVLADLVRGGLSPRLWTDAYLAAFALAGGHRLVTFDQDFLRFPGLEVLRLFP